MKLLQAIAGAEYGGAENFFVRLASALQKTNIEQRVIIRSNKTRANALKKAGVEFTELRFGGVLDWGSKIKFRKIVNQFEPDIVLTWMNRATQYFSRKEHENLTHIARLGGFYNLKYYTHCDHLICNTQGIQRYLKENGWREENLDYLPNFVKVGDGDPIQRKHYFTPENAPVVLGMGRFHENKGFDILLEAISRVPGVYLWLAGAGPLRNDLEILAEKLSVKPRVRFLGWHENITPLLRAANVFVCASRREPLGNVILEAWAHEVPVVSSDIDGPGELIEHLVSGILVPVDNPILLSRAIRNLLVDSRLCQKIVDNGKLTFESEFTEKKVTNKYLEFFQGIVEKCAESQG